MSLESASVVLTLVMPVDVEDAVLETLLALLRERFATSRVFFWMVPAIASGRLA